MSYETYHIPVNFTDAGKLFGVFEIRNAVETVLLCIGIGGDSLTRWLKAWINWRKRRRMIFYRGGVRL